MQSFGILKRPSYFAVLLLDKEYEIRENGQVTGDPPSNRKGVQRNALHPFPDHENQKTYGVVPGKWKLYMLLSDEPAKTTPSDITGEASIFPPVAKLHSLLPVFALKA